MTPWCRGVVAVAAFAVVTLKAVVFRF